jgi:DNA-binding response OmpR family regulator
MSRILLVDDDPDLLDLGATALEGEDHEVEKAPDGDSAIRLFLSEAFDVVMTDVQMPGKDGFQLLEDIRRCSPDTPVILGSCQCNRRDRLKALRSGASGYVEKPFDMARLRGLIARAVALHGSSPALRS